MGKTDNTHPIRQGRMDERERAIAMLARIKAEVAALRRQGKIQRRVIGGKIVETTDPSYFERIENNDLDYEQERVSQARGS